MWQDWPSPHHHLYIHGGTILYVFPDMTDYRQSQGVIRDREDICRLMLETISEGVVLLSASGEILFRNKSADDILGISQEDTQGLRLDNRNRLLLHEDGSKCEEKDQPWTKTLRTGKPCKNKIVGIKLSSGDCHWISINTNPIFSSKSATPRSVAISFYDITKFKDSNDDLVLKEKTFKQPLETTTDCIWTADFSTSTLLCSPKCYTLLGFCPDDFALSLKKGIKLLHPDDRDKTVSLFSAFMKTEQERLETEFRLRTRSGEYRWMSSLTTAITRNEQGWPIHIVGNIKDITERNRAEEKLKTVEKNYRTLVEHLPQGVFRTLADGSFIDVNPAALQMLGLTQEEFLQRTAHSPEWNIIHEDGSIAAFADFPASIALESGNHSRAVFGVTNKKTGETVWMEVDAQPEFLPEASKPHQVMVTMHDISGRKQALETIQRSEAHFRDLFNKAAVPLCIVNKESGKLDFNNQFEKTFGFTREEIPTMNEWWQRAYPDTAYRNEVLAVCEAALQRAVENNTDLEPIEYQITCKNGKIKHMIVFGGAIDTDFLLTFFDMTLHRQTEFELLKINRAINLSNDAVYLVNEQEKFIYVNDAACRLLGYRRELLLTMSPWDVDPDYNHQAKETITQKIQANGGLGPTERRHRRSDGSFLQVELTLSGIQHEDELLTLVIARDITERKQAEAELHSKERELIDKNEKLEKYNIAMEVVIDQKTDQLKKLQFDLAKQFHIFVTPHIATLKKICNHEVQIKCLDLLEQGVEQIFTPFAQQMLSISRHCSPMEMKVIQRIVKGYTSNEIAEELHISLHTVKFHRKNIRSKLGIRKQNANLQSLLLSNDTRIKE